MRLLFFVHNLCLKDFDNARLGESSNFQSLSYAKLKIMIKSHRATY